MADAPDPFSRLAPSAFESTDTAASIPAAAKPTLYIALAVGVAGLLLAGGTLYGMHWSDDAKKLREYRVAERMQGEVSAAHVEFSEAERGSSSIETGVVHIVFDNATSRYLQASQDTPDARAQRVRVVTEELFPAYCRLRALRPDIVPVHPPRLECRDLPLHGDWWERFE